MTEKLWCGCNGECEGHTVPVVIDGKVQPHLNALDVLKFALAVKTGKRKPLGDISN